MKKRVVFINRFYRPDHSATSQILTDLSLNLDIDHADIHVISSRLYYSDNTALLPRYELLDGINIHRVWTSRFGRGSLLGRGFDYVSFYLSSFICMLRLVKKNDVIVAKTDPPLISFFAAFVCKLKGAILINWLQDLFPEVAAELDVKGMSSGVLYELARKLRNWSLNAATFNVVLGELMADKVKKEISNPESIVVIHNWMVGEEMQPIQRDNNPLIKEWEIANKFVVGYSGNLGRAHDYETIFSAIKILKDDPTIVFLFIGGGAGYNFIKANVKKERLDNVVFKPYQPVEDLAYSLSVPDIHLVSLAPSLEGLIVPSKFYGIIAVGKPIIFIGSKTGEVPKNLEDGGCGITIESNCEHELAENIVRLKDTGSYVREGKRARELYLKRFLPEKSISQWRKIIQQHI